MLEVRELHGTAAPGVSEARSWIGNRVEDVYGAGVGRVEDVVVDSAGTPTWLVVREGRFTTHEVVLPIEGAVGSPGHVWVPHSRDAIRSAPSIPRSGPIEGPVEEALCQHYGVRGGGPAGASLR